MTVRIGLNCVGANAGLKQCRVLETLCFICVITGKHFQIQGSRFLGFKVLACNDMI
jgi:hypothetical protein